MDFNARIKQHTVVNDVPPFVLYAVEVITEFSRSIVMRRYSDFSKFHKELCYFAHTKLKNGSKLLYLLPKLPVHIIIEHITAEMISQRKEELNGYLKSLSALHNNQIFNKTEPWVLMIQEFLQTEDIGGKEIVAAKTIQSNFKKYKIFLEKKAQSILAYQEKGYITQLDELPDEILVNIFAYLTIHDMAKVSLVNKICHQLSEQPMLWSTLNMFPNKFNLDPAQFEGLCERASQLKVLDLRYCEYVNSHIILTIAHICNPQMLHTLKLDGCEQLEDSDLFALVSKFPSPPNLHLEADLKGGARGLHNLSIAECRKISDQGVICLKKLKRLEYLNMLGCANITDEGISLMLSRPHKSISMMNLSGTGITRASLISITENCPNIKEVLLIGCKNINIHDRTVLPCAEIGEDIFRFQLLQMDDTALPAISHNILRTRGTLTVNKVAHFIMKKLYLEENVKIDVIYSQIYCKNVLLSPYMTLRQVQNDIWDESMLTIRYQLSSETERANEIRATQYMGLKLPEWEEDESVASCPICEERFWMLLRKHHCRHCGKIICGLCSRNRVFLPQFGYTKKVVRVCSQCFTFIHK